MDQLNPTDIKTPEPTLKISAFERWSMKTLTRFTARYYLKHSDQAGILAIKFPTFKSAYYGFMNELYFRLGLEKGYKLITINLESTNSCNLTCNMCPVNNGMQRQKGLMDPKLFKKIIDDHPELQFILVFQWGEPMLHKSIFEMIRYAHDRGVQTMMTTNGTIMGAKHVKGILESGLDRIMFSVDGVGETHTRIRGFKYDQLKKNILEFKQLRDAVRSPLKIETSMVVWEETENDIAAYRDEWSSVVDRLQLIPRFEVSPRNNKCRELWRGSAVVMWDGKVTVCCVDSEGDITIGDAKTQPVREIWNGGKMRALRKSHTTKKFNSFCEKCGEYSSDQVSPRFG